MLKRVVIAGLIALLVLAALPLGQPEEQSSYAQEERLRVVTTYSILGDVVQNVAGDAANVTVLMPLGADPHGFQPSAQDIARMVDADVVFINGANFEEGILEIFEDAGDEINAKTVSSCVPIWPFGSPHEHEHDEGEEHEHEEGEEHAHDHGSCDPHVWMEPHNVMYWTMFIRDTLIELDPANAETYTANAVAYLEELDALSHDFVMPMVETVPEENRVLITNHDAYGYFAVRFDFEVAITIIPAGTTLAEPSVADVAAVIDLIREESVPAIFAETTVSDDLAQQIADETGAEVFVLYSGSLSGADGPASTYVDYIRYNVTTIVEALGGGM